MMLADGQVAKSRYHDQIGMTGELTAKFNIDTGRYTIIEDDVWKAA